MTDHDVTSAGLAETPVITLVEPLLGFPDHTTYSLVRLDESGLVCTLVSHADDSVRFLVAAPHVFFPDYAPEIDDESLAALDVDSSDPSAAADDLVVFVLVSSRDGEAVTTANLLAPIVVNHRSRRGVQVLLSDDLPMRAELTLV